MPRPKPKLKPKPKAQPAHAVLAIDIGTSSSRAAIHSRKWT